MILEYSSPFVLYLVCKQGFFGDECSRRCGNCRNKQTCHHINGSCLNGCDEGVKGWNCTTGTRLPKHFFTNTWITVHKTLNFIPQSVAYSTLERC